VNALEPDCCAHEDLLGNPSEPTPHYPAERLMLIHPATGLTVSRDEDTGGVWVKQETGGTMEQVYVCAGAWLVLRDAMVRGLL
jgi:hypothetical protein